MRHVSLANLVLNVLMWANIKWKKAQLPPSATGILAVAGSGRPGRCGSTSARSYILEFKYTLFFFSKTETYFAILHGLEINLSMTDFGLESRNIPKGRKHIWGLVLPCLVGVRASYLDAIHSVQSVPEGVSWYSRKQPAQAVLKKTARNVFADGPSVAHIRRWEKSVLCTVCKLGW